MKQTPIQTHPIDSSVLAATGYDDTTLILELFFRDGAVYRYFEVPSSLHPELLAASSAGAFFNRRIRNRFRHICLRSPAA